MRYKLFGRTGLRVSELCLGAMTFGEDWGWGAPKQECARILDAFAEAGGNFIDTANAYTNGTSERIVGELIAPEREHWVLATKYTINERPADPNAGGSHRKSMVRALDASLERLSTDYLDLYWLHVWDAFTPVEEVVRTLDDAVCAGKVLYVGISDTPAWLVSQAVTLADLRGWTRFVGLQVPYSLVERAVERDLLPMAQALDLAVTTWEPLGGGLLTGRYGTDREPPPGTRIATTEYAQRMLTDRNLAITDAVNRVAAERDATPAQVAIAWVRTQQQRGVIIPIVGARKREQVEDSLGAVDVELAEVELERLNEISRIELGFPHDFVGRALAYGETFDLVDHHRGDVYTQLGTRSLPESPVGQERVEASTATDSGVVSQR
jgi:aryl-alcohol dehydrogenase-like predicted oxidoreductase